MNLQKIIRTYEIDSVYKKLIITYLASVVLGISSHIYVPTTPVPFTTQSLVVLVIGAFLGRKMAVAAVALCVMQAMFGLPFLTITGLMIFKSTTLGYIVGFFFAAYMMGYLAEKNKLNSFKTTFIYSWLAHLLLFVMGYIWLSIVLGDPIKAMYAGVIPFIIPFFIKVGIAASIIHLSRSKI